MKQIFLLVGLSAMLFACKKENEKEVVLRGAAVQLHHGKARTWLRVSAQGAPQQLAISIDDAAMQSLPVGGTDGGGHHHDNHLVLPLHPQAAKATPFRFIGADWNPAGHEGPGYQAPHFDFHYYLMSEAEVLAATDPEKLNLHPDPAYLPQTYVPGPPVPQMGKHWLDLNAPELNGRPFTETFIYGTYNGAVNFYEPMITLAFIQGVQNSFERSIPQPEKFKEAGYYPTMLRIVKQNGTTEFILDGFVYRQAS